MEIVFIIGVIAVGVICIRSSGKVKNIKQRCSYCGSQISVDARECPYCHHKIGFTNDLRAQRKAFVAEGGSALKGIIITILIIVGMVLYAMITNQLDVLQTMFE